MNAPLALPVEPDTATPAVLATDLYLAALRGVVALSDAGGCHAELLDAHPASSPAERRSARRLATDMAQHVARIAETSIIPACEAALAQAERAAAGDFDPHTALAEISDLLAGALAELGASHG